MKSPPPSLSSISTQQHHLSDINPTESMDIPSLQTTQIQTVSIQQTAEQNIQQKTATINSTGTVVPAAVAVTTTTSTPKLTPTMKTVTMPPSLSSSSQQSQFSELSHEKNPNTNIIDPTRNNNNIEMSVSLPQSIAVIKGRKYVVIRKPSIPSSSSSLRQNSINKNSNSGIIGDE